MALNPDKKNERASLHKDHRKRVKEKFRTTGLEGFHDHNVLEMLLFYAIPRCDTNEIAHLLLNEFGSFNAVFEASIDELTNVEGIGLEAATLIRFMAEVMKYNELDKVKDFSSKPVFDSPSAAKILKPYFKSINYEKFVIVFLDARGVIINLYEYTQESYDSVITDFTTILQKAVINKAKGIIVAHNHPNGFAVPSQEDIILTEKLSTLCKPLDIIFCEHIIFSGKEQCFLSKTKGVKRGVCAF